MLMFYALSVNKVTSVMTRKKLSFIYLFNYGYIVMSVEARWPND